MPRLLYVSYTPFGVELADMCSAPMLEMVSLLLTSVTGFGDSLIFCHMVVPPMTISTSQNAGPGRILSPLGGFHVFQRNAQRIKLPLLAGQLIRLSVCSPIA